MIRKRGEIQVFSLSFLDVLSCALGGVLVLLLASNNNQDRGVVFPIPLIFRADWDKDIDIDLWVQDPERWVWYDEKNSEFGALMRDNVVHKERFEVYYSIVPRPGKYLISAHYFDGDAGPISINLTAAIFSGDPEREQVVRKGPFVLLKSAHGGNKPDNGGGLLLGRFEIKQDGDSYQLIELDR